jgi:PilZ domain
MKFKQDLHEKRNSVRVDFKVPVEISCPETDTVWKGILVNLSIHGMLLEFQNDLPSITIDKRKGCTARLIFQGNTSKLMIDELQFSIARTQGNMLALEFGEPLEWFLLFTVYKNKQIDH